MKIRIWKNIWVTVIITLCMQTMFVFLCLANEKGSPGKAIELRGKIINLKKASKYINTESYLQILLIPDNGGVSFETDNKGRTVYPSNLPKISFSKDGTFSFTVKNIKPGKYVIVGQKLNPYGLDSGLKPILSHLNNKAFIIIQHPDDTGGKNVLNFGDVFLPVPEN